MSNRPACIAFASAWSAASIASGTDAISCARFVFSESNAPARISASTVRRLTMRRSIRSQKSNRSVNGFSSRARRISSIAFWPLPFTAPRP